MSFISRLYIFWDIFWLAAPLPPFRYIFCRCLWLILCRYYAQHYALRAMMRCASAAWELYFSLWGAIGHCWGFLSPLLLLLYDWLRYADFSLMIRCLGYFSSMLRDAEIISCHCLFLISQYSFMIRYWYFSYADFSIFWLHFLILYWGFMRQILRFTRCFDITIISLHYFSFRYIWYFWLFYFFIFFRFSFHVWWFLHYVLFISMLLFLIRFHFFVASQFFFIFMILAVSDMISVAHHLLRRCRFFSLFHAAVFIALYFRHEMLLLWLLSSPPPLAPIDAAMLRCRAFFAFRRCRLFCCAHFHADVYFH